MRTVNVEYDGSGIVETRESFADIPVSDWDFFWAVTKTPPPSLGEPSDPQQWHPMSGKVRVLRSVRRYQFRMDYGYVTPTVTLEGTVLSGWDMAVWGKKEISESEVWTVWFPLAVRDPDSPDVVLIGGDGFFRQQGK